MSWLWATLTPHPPIIVPEVGQGKEQEASVTLGGIRQLCAQLTAIHQSNPPDSLPEVLLVLSPHQPYIPGSLFLNSAPVVQGSLRHFGAASIQSSLTTPTDALDALSMDVRAAGIPCAKDGFADLSSDHGALVPLFFLAQTFPGHALPPVILANPSGITPEQALMLGKVLRADRKRSRWALLASGDLSHRLKPGAPAGYSPDGEIFDRAAVSTLRTGDPSALLSLSETVRNNAGECGLRPVLTLLGLCAGPLDIFSYEGPFGVGYCTALCACSSREKKPDKSLKREPAAKQGSSLVLLARKAIAAALANPSDPDQEEPIALAADNDLLNSRKACFVSIKNKEGFLRGCIGTFLPSYANLAEEIKANAVAAATKDPRFPPMWAEELNNVHISVDVLGTPEAVQDKKDLDPSVWGVIISKGRRCGLLLPDLPGVHTVEQQLAIAAQKGGMHNLNGAQIHRFPVERHTEDQA